MEIEILEKYPVKVHQMYKSRGGLCCETDSGLFVLRELIGCEERIIYLDKLLQEIKKYNFINVDGYVKNKEGGYAVSAFDGKKYILKNWFNGSECDVKKDLEIVKAVKNMAVLHNCLEKAYNQVGKYKQTAIDLKDECQKHNKEINKVKNYIEKGKRRSEFEVCFRKNVDAFYEQGEKVIEMLEKQEKAEDIDAICHGDYIHHNIINTQNGMVTLNFERFKNSSQMIDLYNFMRKVMEKRNWNKEIGMMMIQEYEKKRKIDITQKQFLYYRLAYPEKFWKIANHYYNSNKAWIPDKITMKIKRIENQEPSRKDFLKMLYNFVF